MVNSQDSFKPVQLNLDITKSVKSTIYFVTLKFRYNMVYVALVNALVVIISLCLFLLFLMLFSYRNFYCIFICFSDVTIILPLM